MRTKGGSKRGNDGVGRGMHAVKEKGCVFGGHKVGRNNAEFREHRKNRSGFGETTCGTDGRSVLFCDKRGELSIVTPDGGGPHSNILDAVEDNLSFFINVKVFSEKGCKGIIKGFGESVANIFLVGFV